MTNPDPNLIDALAGAFEHWWLNEGSGMPPLPDEDHEEHTRRIARIAWHNGGYIMRQQQQQQQENVMSEAITTPKLLDFLTKANKVASRVDVRKQVQGMYQIGIYCDWDDDSIFYTKATYISEGGHPTYTGSKYEFSTIDNMLDELVQKKEERETEDQN